MLIDKEITKLSKENSDKILIVRSYYKDEVKILDNKIEEIRNKKSSASKQFETFLNETINNLLNDKKVIKDNLERCNYYFNKEIYMDNLDIIKKNFIEINKIEKTFFERLESVEKILPISQEKNDIIIIGKNGSGKSRYLKEIYTKSDSKNFIYIPAFREYFKGDGYKRPEKNMSFNDMFKFFDLRNEHINSIEKITDGLLSKYYHSTERKEYEDKNEKISKIWKIIFSNTSELKFKKDKIIQLKGNDEIETRNFSDGEYNILIILLLCIFVDENAYVAIDEIELHLNMYQLKKLIYEIKKERPDIKLLLTTHNYYLLQEFNDKSIYYMNNNTLNLISNLDDIQNDVNFMNEFGNPRNIVFCEGTSSTDERLYSLLFPDYNVKGAGNCEEVKKITDVLSKIDGASNIFAIIDKDNLSEINIEKLRDKNIFVLPYRHKENFLICEEMISIYNNYLNNSYDIDLINEKLNNFKTELRSRKIDLNFSKSYRDTAIQKLQSVINKEKTPEKIIEKISELIHRKDFLEEIKYPVTYDEYLKVSTNKKTCNRIIDNCENRFIRLLEENPKMAIEIRDKYFSEIPKIQK